MKMDLRHRVLAERHNKQNLSDEETAEIADDETDSEHFNPPEDSIFLETTPTFASVLGTSGQTQTGNLSDKDPAPLIKNTKVSAINSTTNKSLEKSVKISGSKLRHQKVNFLARLLCQQTTSKSKGESGNLQRHLKRKKYPS